MSKSERHIEFIVLHNAFPITPIRYLTENPGIILI